MSDLTILIGVFAVVLVLGWLWWEAYKEFWR